MLGRPQSLRRANCLFDWPNSTLWSLRGHLRRFPVGKIWSPLLWRTKVLVLGPPVSPTATLQGKLIHHCLVDGYHGIQLVVRLRVVLVRTFLRYYGSEGSLLLHRWPLLTHGRPLLRREISASGSLVALRLGATDGSTRTRCGAKDELRGLLANSTQEGREAAAVAGRYGRLGGRGRRADAARAACRARMNRRHVVAKDAEKRRHARSRAFRELRFLYCIARRSALRLLLKRAVIRLFSLRRTVRGSAAYGVRTAGWRAENAVTILG